MWRPSQTTLYLFVVALGLATISRLIGLIDHLLSVATNHKQAVDAIISFWSPTIKFSLALFLLLYLANHWWSTDDTEGATDSSVSPFNKMVLAGRDDNTMERILNRSENVLEEQLSVLNDTDDKAVRTVRVEVILLAAIASAAQIGNGSLPLNIWMKIGGVLIIASIVAGIFTYSSSQPDFGPGPRYVQQWIADAAEKEKIHLELMNGYSKAINHNRGVIEDSSVYLYATQILLVLGIVFGGIGVLTVLNNI